MDERADFTFYKEDSKQEIIPKISCSFHTKSEGSKKLLAAYKELEQKMVHLTAKP